jgi:hypothetical protein
MEALQDRTAYEMYTHVNKVFKNKGVTEDGQLWSDFIALRCSDEPNTRTFVDKFRAKHEQLLLTKRPIDDEWIIFQFLDAIKSAYPQYESDRRRDLRHEIKLTLSDLMYDLTADARQDDLVRRVALAAKKDKNKDKEKTEKSKAKANDRQNSRPTSCKCVVCDTQHPFGKGKPCYWLDPKNAPEKWKQSHPDWEKTGPKKFPTKGATANTTVAAASTSDESVDFSVPHVYAAILVQVSDQVQKLASIGDYRVRTILDTGANEHICNTLDKFVKIDRRYSGNIKTGGGPATVEGKGTILLNLVKSSGEITRATFADVLYCPTMFVSIISHSKVRSKGLYYHGNKELLLTRDEEEEIAIVPEIDGILNLIEADNEIDAARALAIATVQSTSKPTSLIPTRKVTLAEAHQIFGHLNVLDVRKSIDAGDGLEITNSTNTKFDCEPCLLLKSTKQISRQPMPRTAKSLHTIHLDIVGPITPTSTLGNKYWILYTDEATRYRWIDLVKSASDITTAFLNFHQRVRTQYGATVAIYHLDNDLKLINRTSIETMKRSGTVFRTSTPYTAH